MTGRLRSSRVNEFEVGEVFSRVIKGLRNEMSGVIGEIEKNKNITVEGMKGLLKSSLETLVSSVEKMMNGASDELAGERKRREEEERSREERIRGMEERRGKEQKRRIIDERRMEDRVRSIEQKAKEREESDRIVGEKIASLEGEAEKRREELTKEFKKMEGRLEKVEKGEKERERLDKEFIEYKEVDKEREKFVDERDAAWQAKANCMESEKEMEKVVGAAMEKIKVLDLDFTKILEGREEITKVALDLIKEKVKPSERKEWDWSMRRSRVYVLGKATKEKEYEGRKIFTVPILISCPCIGDKVRMERILRNSGIRASFHWPAVMMDFVGGVRERVEGMGHGGQEEYVRVRAVKEEGGIRIRAEARKKEGGNFKWIGDWLCPPINKNFWKDGVLDDVWMPYRRRAGVGNGN